MTGSSTCGYGFAESCPLVERQQSGHTEWTQEGSPNRFPQ